MDLFKAVNERYSYRGEYKNEPVPREDLIKIVDCGIKAPSGKNLQTTEFVIIDDETILKKVREVLPETIPLKTCGAIIACIIDQKPDIVYQGSHFQLEDCAAAVENMLLAITASGYASVWLDGVLRREDRAERLGEIIGLPLNKKVQVILPVGKAVAEGTRREKLSFEERAWFNNYKK